jgi:hypothetical protein
MESRERFRWRVRHYKLRVTVSGFVVRFAKIMSPFPKICKPASDALHGPNEFLNGRNESLHGESDILHGLIDALHGGCDFLNGQNEALHGGCEIQNGRKQIMGGQDRSVQAQIFIRNSVWPIIYQFGGTIWGQMGSGQMGSGL